MKSGLMALGTTLGMGFSADPTLAAGTMAWAEMSDRAGGQYRCVGVCDNRLMHCLFIGPDHRLPGRDWLLQLFAKEPLTAAERARLLAGSPGAGQEDAGKTVCACFNVGENVLIKGVREQGLATVDEIGRRLLAGTNCGSCIAEIRAIIAAG